MAKIEDRQYDVFISYAHADAKDPESRKLVERIKKSIEEALKPVLSHHPFVFLDSEALQWGDEWSAKIASCIKNCYMFVYLLSPNYLKSNYCQREKLWWAYKEITNGLLNKSTRPIYYIRLRDTGNPVIDKYISELRICQSNDQPFFESLEAVRHGIVEARLQDIQNFSNGIPKKFELILNEDIAAKKYYCTIEPQLSCYFVGRLDELAELNQRCYEYGKIPVISGAPGVGKSELAVAYAYAYRVNFPQGLFLVPMGGVKNWNKAMESLLEMAKSCSLENNEKLQLPDDVDKLSPDEKRIAVFRMLVKRSKEGPLLLLLDNLEDLDMLSEKGIRELTDGTGAHRLHTNMHIIATTRLNMKDVSDFDAIRIYPIDNLTEKDAFELFCKIGGNIFPFANYPIMDGKILFPTEGADNSLTQDDKDRINDEYAAMLELIELLGGHAWSLEITAGFMVNNYGCYSFRDKLKELNENYSDNFKWDGAKRSKSHTPEQLMRQTFDRLLDFNDVSEHLGDNIMLLATIASFFPPEQVPKYALEGIWCQEFGNDLITYDNGYHKARSCALAMEQLKIYRIVNGDGPILKMHRLTRDVLRKRLKGENEQFALNETMRKFLNAFLSETSNPTVQQLLPWFGWAENAMSLLNIKNNGTFLATFSYLANESRKVNLFDNAYMLLQKSLAFTFEYDIYPVPILINMSTLLYDLQRYKDALGECDYALTVLHKKTQYQTNDWLYEAEIYTILGNIHNNQNLHEKAEYDEEHVLSIVRELEKSEPGRYKSNLAHSLGNLANTHKDLNRTEEAEAEFKDAIEIWLGLAKDNSEQYTPSLAQTFNDYATLLYSLNRFTEAEDNYNNALKIRRKLAKDNPARFNFDLAVTLLNYAVLNKTLKQYTKAETIYNQALSIFIELTGTDNNTITKYTPFVARTYYNIAILHRRFNLPQKAEDEYNKALTLFRILAQHTPDAFNLDIAKTLFSLAILHESLKRFTDAEAEYKEATCMYQVLADNNPNTFNSDLAKALFNLALMYYKLDCLKEAEEYFTRALRPFRELTTPPEGTHLMLRAWSNPVLYHEITETIPKQYLPDVAKTLKCLAIVHSKLKRKEEAKAELNDALDIYRELAQNDHQKYDSDLEDTLSKIASLNDSN